MQVAIWSDAFHASAAAENGSPFLRNSGFQRGPEKPSTPSGPGYDVNECCEALHRIPKLCPESGMQRKCIGFVDRALSAVNQAEPRLRQSQECFRSSSLVPLFARSTQAPA